MPLSKEAWLALQKNYNSATAYNPDKEAEQKAANRAELDRQLAENKKKMRNGEGQKKVGY